MRPSSLYTNGRLRLRVRSARLHNAPLSYSSAAIGTRRKTIVDDNNESIVSTAFSLRKQEFVRKRVLYFSSGFPNNNDNCSNNINRLLGISRYDNKKQQKPPHKDYYSVMASPLSLAPSATVWIGDSQESGNGNGNLPPLMPIPSSVMENQQRRWYYIQSANARVATSIDSSLPSTLPISMPMSSSSSTSTPGETAKIMMDTTLKDDNNKNESQVRPAESTISAAGVASSDEKDGSSENENENNNNNNNTAIESNTVEEKGYKRVRTIRVPQYGPDADKAVRSLQIARKERARIKTSINVQRALYGNMIICAAKLGAWLSSGSSSMMSEFIHSVVDCGNQALLLVGLRHTRNAADKRHPYGYGKSVYFWALVSALGTFFMGAGLSMSHSVQTLFHPTLTESINNEVWFVLAMSFVIDGYVLSKTFAEIQETRPKGMPLAKYISKLRDPATLAVLLEDGAACLGIVIAIAGIAASHHTSNPIYDGIAGVGISCLLGGIGLALVRVNHSFLIGQGVERDMLDKIEEIIRNRRSIENVTGIQSQWTGPETFSFKAELDFDGTYLSALLMPRYRAEFKSAGDALDEDLEVLLSWYAEDVIRAVEREVRHIEAVIRQQYPGAEYIELEPMSKYVDRFAIDDSFEEKLLMIEKKELKKWVRVLYENKDDNASWSTIATGNTSEDSSGGNVISGSVPTDILPESGSTPGDKLENK